MLPWFAFSAASALAEATNQAISKRYLRSVDPLITSLALSLFSLPWLALALPVDAWPSLSPTIAGALLISALGYGTARILFIDAILSSPLSVTVPINSFTPVFLVFTSWIILGEVPSALGIFGIAMIVVGSYLLNLNLRSSGFLEPFRALLKERGPRLMLIVAFLWSIAPNFDKIGLTTVPSIVWVFMLNVVMTILTATFILIRYKGKLVLPRSAIPVFAVNGLLMAIMLLGHVTALTLTLVTYASAVRRINSIFGVLYGVWLFGETDLRDRLIAALVMTLGAAIVVLA